MILFYWSYSHKNYCLVTKYRIGWEAKIIVTLRIAFLQKFVFGNIVKKQTLTLIPLTLYWYYKSMSGKFMAYLFVQKKTPLTSVEGLNISSEVLEHPYMADGGANKI